MNYVDLISELAAEKDFKFDESDLFKYFIDPIEANLQISVYNIMFSKKYPEILYEKRKIKIKDDRELMKTFIRTLNLYNIKSIRTSPNFLIYMSENKSIDDLILPYLEFHDFKYLNAKKILDLIGTDFLFGKKLFNVKYHFEMPDHFEDIDDVKDYFELIYNPQNDALKNFINKLIYELNTPEEFEKYLGNLFDINFHNIRFSAIDPIETIQKIKPYEKLNKNFVKNLLTKIKDTALDEKKYTIFYKIPLWFIEENLTDFIKIYLSHPRLNYEFFENILVYFFNKNDKYLKLILENFYLFEDNLLKFFDTLEKLVGVDSFYKSLSNLLEVMNRHQLKEIVEKIKIKNTKLIRDYINFAEEMIKRRKDQSYRWLANQLDLLK